MDILSDTLVQVLSTVIVGGLTLLTVQAFAYLKSKTSLIQDEQIKNITNDTLDKVEKLINTNITAIDSVTKPTIVESIKDGRVDKSELNTLAKIVKEQVLDQMGSDSLDILNNTLGNVDNYIANKIEEQLALLKADVNSPVTKTEITK